MSSFKSPSKALVLEVHRGPSNTVKALPKFSPRDLHCYTFWLVTGGGILDLFAYNQEAYEVWVSELEHLAGKNASTSVMAKGSAFKNSSVYSRPSSSHSTVSKASIAPSLSRASGQGATPVVRESVGLSRSSIFTVPQGVEIASVGGKASFDGKGEVGRKLASRQARVLPDSSSLAAGQRERTTRVAPVQSFIGESFRPNSAKSQSDHPIYSDDGVII